MPSRASPRRIARLPATPRRMTKGSVTARRIAPSTSAGGLVFELVRKPSCARRAEAVGLQATGRVHSRSAATVELDNASGAVGRASGGEVGHVRSVDGRAR